MMGVDKLYHFTLSLLVYLISTSLSNLPIGIAFTLAGGIGKEAYDMLAKNGTGWSWLDLLADVLGIVAGATLMYYLH
jgi:uncharacterized protein YfiM (DUF2279 family)